MLNYRGLWIGHFDDEPIQKFGFWMTDKVDYISKEGNLASTATNSWCRTIKEAKTGIDLYLDKPKEMLTKLNGKTYRLVEVK